MRKFENLDFIHENTLKPRAHYIPYDTLEKALKGDKFQSKYYMLLNGEWEFKYYKRDIDCPATITEWDKVNVPSCWQSTGYEKPYYTNHNYPYPVDPPYLPDDIPVGVYKKVFNITKNQSELENYIIFEGVSPCVELYHNGKYIGFSTVSHSTSEFKLDLVEGENEIICKVYKMCASSYLEDQDFFRNQGIFRDVYLLFRNKGHLFDIEIPFDSKGIYYKGEYKVYDKDGNETDLSSPILWNAENPYLYTVVINSSDEYIPFKIGLRDQSISKKGELLINGVPVKLKGINHHDTHPYDGYTMSYEFMLNDLKKMKELNINTIRTSHYPPQPAFIELCDELGFYVIDEADIETHGFTSRNATGGYDEDIIWPCKNPMWKDAFVDRAQRLFERDKNHSCVIMWSLGNEANYGENFDEMSAYIKGRENELNGIKRLIHYCYCGPHADVRKDPEALDVISRMYWVPSWVIRYLDQTGDTRPFFFCEYSHAMGNGPGDVTNYNTFFENNPNVIGGCIWEWADHVALKEDGTLGYGGDFGEEVHDGNFCCDGLVFNNREFKPGSYEAKYAYQPLATEFENNILTVHNKYDFTDLSACELKLVVTSDGNIVKTDILKLNTKPHTKESIALDLEIPDSIYGSYLNIYLIKDGQEVAHTQHCLKDANALKAIEEKAVINHNGEFATISGDGFDYTFNMHYGYIEKLNDFLKAPLKFSIWRAPTDNDRRIKNDWYVNHYDRMYNKVYSSVINENTITIKGALSSISRSPFFRYTATYSFFKDGTIDVSINGEFDNEREFIPRLGFETEIAQKDFSYFGYGPYESYIDMHHASEMGMYESSAEKEYVDYIKPQEHGNHYNTKLLKFNGFEITSQKGFEFAVSEYSAKELEKKAHNYELEKSENTHLRIDYKNSGIGSASCFAPLKEQYKMNDKNISFNFRIKTK